MAIKKQWYAVKSVIKYQALGKPQKKIKGIKHYAGDLLIEERIILLRAKSFVEAIALAEKECANYCRPAIRNCFGQKVIHKSIGFSDAYLIGSLPKHNEEIFSSTILIDKKSNIKTFLDHLTLRSKFRNDRKRRVKFQQ